MFPDPFGIPLITRLPMASAAGKVRNAILDTVKDIIHRSLSSVRIPSDGKCISLVPWKQGKVLVWDATCPDTFAPSHLPSAAMSSGAVAQQVELVKSTHTWMQATSSSQWLWRHKGCWVQRPSNCFETSDTTSGRQLGNKGPFSFSSSMCLWLCKENQEHVVGICQLKNCSFS